MRFIHPKILLFQNHQGLRKVLGLVEGRDNNGDFNRSHTMALSNQLLVMKSP